MKFKTLYGQVINTKRFKINIYYIKLCNLANLPILCAQIILKNIIIPNKTRIRYIFLSKHNQSG